MINRDHPVPLYQQIAADIAHSIRTGQVRFQQRIPSESDLCNRFGVARGTVRLAVAQLRADRLVFTVPHRGTYATRVGTITEVPY